MPVTLPSSRCGRAARLFAALALSGCAQTHLYSGLPPGKPAHGLNDRWHSSYLFGTTDNGRPYKLEKACPGGWSEIVVAQDTFTTILSLATLFLYTPARVTIVCARDTGPLEPARATDLYPPPADVFDD
jgi:hypothetical protein